MGKKRDDTIGMSREELLARVEALEVSNTTLLASNDSLLAKNARLEQEKRLLLDQVDYFKRVLFGHKSEKACYISKDRTGLLPFPEYLADKARAEELLEENRKEPIRIPAHERRSHGRRCEFPKGWPHVTDVHELDEFARVCDCGSELKEIGAETSKRIERIEINIIVEDVVKKYLCESCGAMAMAKKPNPVLDRCILGPGAIAQIIYDRFACHTPYARLEKKWKDEGLNVSRSVMCETVLKVGRILEPVAKALREEVLSAGLVQSDETEVLERKGRQGGKKKVRVCLWRSPGVGSVYTIFDGKSRDGPRSVIGDRTCILQSDGASNYQKLGNGIRHAGCWAHLRRYFHKALKRGDKGAEAPLEMIRKVFRAESELAAQDLEDQALLREREARVRPLVEDFFTWSEVEYDAIRHGRSEILPKSPLAKGVTYAHQQKGPLRLFLTEAAIRDITNNASERDLRSVVLGRKNWLWFGSEEGGQVGAILMSLVHSAKNLGLNPQEYLRDLMEAVSLTPSTEVHSLTPRGWKDCPKAKRRVEQRKQRLHEILTRLEMLPA